MIELQEKEVIVILDKSYKVSKHANRYYLESTSKHKNYEMFTALNLDRKSIFNQVLGYYDGGDFPWCNSLADLTKIVEAINKFINKEEQLNYEIY